MKVISFLIFVLIFSINISHAEDCHLHPQRENCLYPDQIKRGGGKFLDTIGELNTDFEIDTQNVWIDESQTGVRWRIEKSNSPWESNNTAPKPLVGGSSIRVDRGVTASFGVAVLRSQIFRIPSSSNVSISFDFWIRSKWPQFTNLELHFNENGNERLLVSLSEYSDINNRNWITSPELALRSQSESSNTSLAFYAYCGMDIEDAVVIDNIRLIATPTTEPPTTTTTTTTPSSPYNTPSVTTDTPTTTTEPTTPTTPSTNQSVTTDAMTTPVVDVGTTTPTVATEPVTTTTDVETTTVTTSNGTTSSMTTSKGPYNDIKGD